MLGDRARELRPLELVAEDRRRRLAHRLDGVDEGEPGDDRDDRRNRGEHAVEAQRRAASPPGPRRSRRSLDGRAERHVVLLGVDLAAHEPARHPGLAARLDHELEALARRVRDRDQHAVGVRSREHSRRVGERAVDRGSLDAPPAELRVVVEKADRTLVRASRGARGARLRPARPAPTISVLRGRLGPPNGRAPEERALAEPRRRRRARRRAARRARRSGARSRRGSRAATR